MRKLIQDHITESTLLATNHNSQAKKSPLSKKKSQNHNPCSLVIIISSQRSEGLRGAFAAILKLRSRIASEL